MAAGALGSGMARWYDQGVKRGVAGKGASGIGMGRGVRIGNDATEGGGPGVTGQRRGGGDRVVALPMVTYPPSLTILSRLLSFFRQTFAASQVIRFGSIFPISSCFSVGISEIVKAALTLIAPSRANC